MEYWLFSPQVGASPAALLERATAAEAAGFTGVALMDHLVVPLGDGVLTWEAMTLASWLLARTGRLRLGHLVLCDAFREPAVLAQQVTTLDHLSGGRFELGLGAGSWPRELEGFGLRPGSPRARVDRLEASLRVLHQVLEGRPTDVHELVQHPRPLGRIPLVIGATGPRMLGIVAAHADWWNLPAPDLDRLDALRSRVAPARVSVQLAVAVTAPGRAAEVESRVRRRLPGLGSGLFVGEAATLRRRIGGLADRGVERVYLWPADDPGPASITSLGAALLG